MALATAVSVWSLDNDRADYRSNCIFVATTPFSHGIGQPIA
jgi:hypothetical protein